jgi:hypothetical protein
MLLLYRQTCKNRLGLIIVMETLGNIQILLIFCLKQQIISSIQRSANSPPVSLFSSLLAYIMGVKDVGEWIIGQIGLYVETGVEIKEFMVQIFCLPREAALLKRIRRAHCFGNNA